MKKRSAKEVLESVIELLLKYISELFEYKDSETYQFQYGERTAYTECLEYIRQWEYAEACGLDFDIEEKYTL